MSALVKACEGCRFSVPAATTVGDLLVCRRFPPLAGITALVRRDEWCGEWLAVLDPFVRADFLVKGHG